MKKEGVMCRNAKSCFNTSSEDNRKLVNHNNQTVNQTTKTRSIIMRYTMKLAIVLAVMFSLVIANEPIMKTAVDVAPIFKNHRQEMVRDNVDSMRTVLTTLPIFGTQEVVRYFATTLREGSNWTNSINQEYTPSSTCSECNIYFDQGHFGNPENAEQSSLSISSSMQEDNILWRGQYINHRDGSSIPAEYPLATSYDYGLVSGFTYYLTSYLDIPYDYQEMYIVLLRFTHFDANGNQYISPGDDDTNNRDQQGWPVDAYGWDLRPNIYISDTEITNANGVISSSNPAVIGQDLRVEGWFTENEGFWAGDNIEIEYYKDNSSSEFDDDETEEIDAGETDAERSTYFSFSTSGQHSVTIKIDTYDDVNETDESSSNNEITLYFNVEEAPAAPTVDISIQRTNWRNVLMSWVGNDANNDVLEYRYKMDSEAWSAWGGTTSRAYTNLSSGQHTFYVEVRDPGGLTGSDNETFSIDQPVVVSDISNQTITYGQTLEFDISVSGGSGNYSYSANYGSIDANGHYTWTPPYSPNPYDELVTVSCTSWPINYDSDGFSITVNLPGVVIDGLDDNYPVPEGDALSDASISASGGDGTSYSWILTPNTTGGGWLTLTSYSGSLTGITGTAPYVNEETVYNYTLSCVSQSISTAQDFTVTVSDIELAVEPEIDTAWVVLTQEIDGFTVSASGLEDGQYVWSIGLPPTSNNGNTYWYGLEIQAGIYGNQIAVTGTPQSVVDLPIYVGKYNAWQIQGVTNVLINAFPAVFFNVQPNYSFFQYQAGQIQLNAAGGNNSDYTWSIDDTDLLTIDSTRNNSTWFSVNTSNSGTFQVNVTSQQADFPENSHTEQINFDVQGSFWSVSPLQVSFPAVQDTEMVIISNTTVNGSPFNYTLSLSNWAYYNILSPLSGNVSSGESDTVKVVSYENNEPYPLSAQLTVSINGGAYASIVSLLTEAATTSLQMFSFNGGNSVSQPLTIWNKTDTEQIITLDHVSDIFSISDNELVLAAGDSTIVEVEAVPTDIMTQDTLFVLADDLESQVLLRKYETPSNSIAYDDGLPDVSIYHDNYFVNEFDIANGDALIGMSIHLPINNQSFTWIVMDDEFNELAAGEAVNSFTGWQRIDYPSSFEGNANYYIGIKPTIEEDVIAVGYEVGGDTVSYWYSNGDFEMLPGLCFIRALTNGVVSVSDDMISPEQYTLSQNYPNPFNPSTTISYKLPKTSKVNLTIYSLTGNTVITLTDEVKQAGDHSVIVDLGQEELSSGIYLYRLMTPEFQATRKITYLK